MTDNNNKRCFRPGSLTSVASVCAHSVGVAFLYQNHFAFIVQPRPGVPFTLLLRRALASMPSLVSKPPNQARFLVLL